MGCLSHRKKETVEFGDQKWEYVSLDDFKARGCGPGFAYGWLWVLLTISVAVYVVDSIVAVNLLIFDRWSGSIEPGIPLHISKWIFSVCILLSFINLGFESWRAIRVIKRDNVVESFLDPLAVRWESIRMGSGQGWKRFLVFAELTKSKKGGEYIAIFTYFQLTAWIRVLVCSGPIQVVNAFTFKSVYESKLAVSEDNVEDSITGFFEKIGVLAKEDYQQAVILFGMCFTFVIWVFSFVFLLAAILFYVFFLWHWIPRADGGLRGYCARKVNQALRKIVTKKVNKALAKSQAKQEKAMADKPILDRAATLPTLPNIEAGPMPMPSKQADALPQMPILSRADTGTTLPPYSSRTGTPGNIEMESMSMKRPAPSRTGTMGTLGSTASYSSRTPLVGAAADISESEVPEVPPVNLANLQQPRQPGTPSSERTFGMGGRGMGHAPSGSNGSIRTPGSQDMYGPPAGGYDNFSRPSPGPGPRQYEAYIPDANRGSPAPSSYQRGMPAQRPYDGYDSHQQFRSATGPMPPRGPQYGPQHPPQRNMTAPMPPRGPGGGYQERPLTPQDFRVPPPREGFDRSGTPQSQRGGPYGYDIESQQSRGYGW